MRFGKGIDKVRNIKQKRYFAWLPIKIKGETRWLETVTINGYYYIGELSENLYFMPESFAD